MAFDFRPLAVLTAAFTAFVNLYAPQALLPELSRRFGVGASEVTALMTAGTAAIALTAPFTGALADVVGRKRLITAAAFAVVVPTLIMAAVEADGDRRHRMGAVADLMQNGDMAHDRLDTNPALSGRKLKIWHVPDQSRRRLHHIGRRRPAAD
jgi:hypothetical protein